MTRLITNVAPSQLVLSKDGTLKVAFFDRVCKVDVKRDDKGREISFTEVPKLFIHIEIPADNTTVVERPATERKVRNGDDTIWVHEKELFARAYEKYTALKNEVVFDPHAEIEELKKKLAAAEAAKAKPEVKSKVKAKSKAEDISELENADKETKSEE
jgi:hypothetical protein